MTRHGIAEWYGEPFARMTAARRRALAAISSRGGLATKADLDVLGAVIQGAGVIAAMTGLVSIAALLGMFG